MTVPFAVDVLMHHRERYRPSSTGNLVERVVNEAHLHLYRRERGLTAADLQRPGKDLWILHPHGLPAPATTNPADVQVLLLDGAWREATAMAQEVGRWGRLVSLPMTGESRYWLRAKGEGARYSTVEALLFLLQHFVTAAGFADSGRQWAEEHRKLRRQFELHVYASLRSRGHKEEAKAFLADSPILTELAEFVAALDVPRPR